MASQKSIEDLDHEKGDTSPPKTKSTRAKRSRPRTSASSDTKFRGRLDEVIERIAASFEERGDDELAGILREDGPVMATGLTSLTALLSPLRLPLLVALSIIEPVLAFGRLFRLLANRYVERREAALRAQQDGEPEPAPGSWEPGVATPH